MTPFASVAILEKLALLKIAFCKAPVLSNASWRRTSVMPGSVLPASSAKVGPFPVLDMADFREKRTPIRIGTALVGPADCDLAQSDIQRASPEANVDYHGLSDGRLSPGATN